MVFQCTVELNKTEPCFKTLISGLSKTKKVGFSIEGLESSTALVASYYCQ